MSLVRVTFLNQGSHPHTQQLLGGIAVVMVIVALTDVVTGSEPLSTDPIARLRRNGSPAG